ncbi:hypothetical protein H0H81_000816 [Sphagnurus paluster]|uniref:HMG box domain-containing protein n=1 Tax=Sphagnurus paluster TaxID=117069 RepID=A0A9P7K4U3_9AGAR|nr:hypothetical protein H0H81_000816 [Sphagnurus paluster]
MPAFRNLKTRRSSGRIWNKDPIVYDENGWEIPPIHCGQQTIPSPHSTATSPSTAPADSDFETEKLPTRKSKGKCKASTDPNHVPRPKNAFIFFRSHYYQTQGGSDQNQISVAAGKAWKALGDEEKLPFQKMAEQEKREHQAKFPHYTYAPGSKACSAKRKTSGKKKTQPSAKKLLVSHPPARALSRRASRTITRTVPRALSPRIQAPITTILHPSPIPLPTPPMFPLTDEGSPTLGEIFSADWAFVATSDIPHLELSPAKTVNDLGVDYSLRPSSYNDESLFQPHRVPMTVEGFFAETLNYDYAVDCYPYLESSGIDWSTFNTTANGYNSPQITGPSYSDYLHAANAVAHCNTFTPEVPMAYYPNSQSPNLINPNIDVDEINRFINLCHP